MACLSVIQNYDIYIYRYLHFFFLVMFLFVQGISRRDEDWENEEKCRQPNTSIPIYKTCIVPPTTIFVLNIIF